MEQPKAGERDSAAETITINFEQHTNRHCGSCTLCCRLMPVPEVDKPANTRCAAQFSKGCRIYHKPGFPRACEVWSCQWLNEADTSGLRRPDRSGYVIDNMPDMVRLVDKATGEAREVMAVQVWCDPKRPEAWRDPALLRWLEGRAEADGTAALVRYDSARAFALFPPVLSHDHEWHKVDIGTIVPSRTGSRLLDRLTSKERS